MNAVAKLVDEVSAVFVGWGLLLGLALLLLGWRWLVVRLALKDSEDQAFAAMRDELRDARFAGTYHRLLERWFLNPLTRLVGDRGELTAVDPKGWLGRNFGVQPWTAKSYALLQLAAALYPIGSLLAVWLAGHEGRLGSLVLLQPADLGWRLLLALALSVAVLGGYKIGRVMDSGDRLQLSFMVIWSTYVPGIAVLTVASDVAGHFVVDFAIASFGVGVGAGVGFCVGAGVGVGAGAGVVAAAIPIAIAVSGVGDQAIFFGALVFAAAVTLFVTASIAELRSTASQLALWFTFTLFALAAVGFLTTRILPVATLQAGVALLIFLALLPLLNAFWDWLSLGMSRGLLAGIRLGRHQGWVPLAWALADLVLAFVFLCGLVATVAAALALLNLLFQAGGGDGGGPLVDLPALFAAVRADPGDPSLYWLYFMFLSTLIPTLLHLLIAGASAMQTLAHWPAIARWRSRTAAVLAEDSVARFHAAVYLTAVPMLGLVVPLGLLWALHWALTAHGGALGGVLIDWAEWIARAVGG